MLLTKINGVDVAFIGDVHLGKTFVTGVPLHRRGERERMVMEQFERELEESADKAEVVIQVGDLFDKFRVSFEVIMETANIIKKVANKFGREYQRFYFLRGNHDGQRDLEKVSAFDILEFMLNDVGNVVFVKALEVVDYPDAKIVLCGWDPIITADEMVAHIEGPVDAVVGHWDIVDISEEKHNLIPKAELKDVTSRVFTGHDHVGRSIDEDGLHITVTGSMQPYSFAEDPEHRLYVTMTKLEFDSLRAPDMLKDKCVRILLEPGETLPEDFDCLQLVGKKIGEPDQEEQEVELGSFDMEVLFREAFTEVGVSVALTDEFLGKYREVRNA